MLDCSPIDGEREMGLVKPEITPGVYDSFHHIYDYSESQARLSKEAEGGSDVRGRERKKVSPNQALPIGMSDTHTLI